MALKGAGPASAATDCEARKVVHTGKCGPLSKPSPNQTQERLRAEIVGPTCTAAGVTANGSAPVLALCRQLLAAGLDPDKALDVYRGATLALRVRSLRQAAELEINSKGTGFARRSDVRTASPMRQTAPVGIAGAPR